MTVVEKASKAPSANVQVTHVPPSATAWRGAIVVLRPEERHISYPIQSSFRPT